MVVKKTILAVVRQTHITIIMATVLLVPLSSRCLAQSANEDRRIVKSIKSVEQRAGEGKAKDALVAEGCRAVPILLAYAERSKSDTQLNFYARVLAWFPAKCKPEFLKGLKSKIALHRKMTASAIKFGTLARELSLADFVEKRNPANTKDQLFAIRKYQWFDCSEFLTSLRKLTKDRDQEVRAEALDALRHLERARHLATLYHLRSRPN